MVDAGFLSTLKQLLLNSIFSFPSISFTVCNFQVQGDAGLNQNISSKTFSAPNLSTLDFSALSVADSQNDLQKYAGDDIVQPVNPYRSIENESFLSGKSSFSGTSRNATNFASAVQKLASPESGHWKYEGNGSSEVSIGTSRTSQHLSNSITGNSRSLNGGRLQNYGMGHRAPIWLDTGDVMGNDCVASFFYYVIIFLFIFFSSVLNGLF